MTTNAVSSDHEAPGFLRQTELRKFLSETQFRVVEENCGAATRREGATVFRQGEPAETLYVLVEGSAELRAKPPGRRVYRTVELIGPGCTFGDESVFGEGSYLFSARTLEEVRLLDLPRAGFDRLTAEHPEIAIQLLKCAGSCLEEIVRRSAILTQAPADVALRRLLHELASDRGTNGRTVPVRMTHAQLAGVLHLSRETVSRMLAKLAAEGTVDLGRGVVRVREQ